MSSERRLQVLRAIVEDHVRTSEPVGSRSVLERHGIGVSAATIRNDMAILEAEGLIQAPHTSAGRVPTDAGYRRFVDTISKVPRLTPAERRAIRDFLADPMDLDDVVERTVRLLAALTRQVAVVQYPSLTRSALQHVELVPMGPRTMVVIITDSGRVEQRLVDLPEGTGPEELRRLRDRVNGAAAGRTFEDARAALAAATEESPADPALAELCQVVAGTLAEEREERLALAGTSSLVRNTTDFGGSLETVISALEEHVVLLRLLQSADPTEAPTGRTPAVAVSIGTEHDHSGLQTTSVVASTYGQEGVGSLGVLGPTRMDYPGTMGAVRAVAAYLSEVLEHR
ncbi:MULTISPECIES: heat-inducible transcriptional repressor HrcA [Kytococcus]|uniref:Heat-inducible transcription repressor HrcA n=1 Tax=Kytococcus schroeteri TaxID=138300 RepID=A0A2I1PBA8_9MICO|nr:MULTISPECIES: heat-inducible transcriptional repressor HrcA [Kytococcus]OFS16151.1 heat-inducible transcriptional repressor HrcA [Kytococcus sp. HMSC28H12]PKZ41900.1 heat-inducible transcriptional repressor HrcA [Kytococcus schroeteri]